MIEYYSDISYEVIDSMIVLSGTAIGREPENKIMSVMHNLAKTYEINVIRSFGFNVPIDRNEHATKLRGYEYWLSIDEAELRKLPSVAIFEFDGLSIYIKKIPSCRYAKLRIEDPFLNPLDRVGGGWRRLLGWLEKHDFKESGIVKCDNAYCLEEIKQDGGIIVMHIYVPVAREKN